MGGRERLAKRQPSERIRRPDERASKVKRSEASAHRLQPLVIRYQLLRLKVGDDLTHITYGNMPRRIASVEELLALKPELNTEPDSPAS